MTQGLVFVVVYGIARTNKRPRQYIFALRTSFERYESFLRNVSKSVKQVALLNFAGKKFKNS